jgi:hypothetical protein
MNEHRDPHSEPPSEELPTGEPPTEDSQRVERLRRLTDRDKVVRAFMQHGRLIAIPAKPSKRDLLLPVILDRCFPEDRPFEEREVNARLAVLHPDVAALRRYLVDGGLMTRESGIYRRARPMASLESEGTSASG